MRLRAALRAIRHRGLAKLKNFDFAKDAAHGSVNRFQYVLQELNGSSELRTLRALQLNLFFGIGSADDCDIKQPLRRVRYLSGNVARMIWEIGDPLATMFLRCR